MNKVDPARCESVAASVRMQDAASDLWWRVALVWSSSSPRRQIPWLVDSYEAAQRCERNSDFIRWMTSVRGESPTPIEVRLNDDGTLDELVGTGHFHLEQMSDSGWWMCLEDDAGREVSVWLNAKSQRIKANYEDRGSVRIKRQAATCDCRQGECQHRTDATCRMLEASLKPLTASEPNADAAEVPAPSPASADSGQDQAADGETLWLWKNGDHFLAFRHLYPCFTPSGDPMTLGEPFGRAIFKHSFNREGRDEHANDLHAGNAAQGCQLWPAGRPLGGGSADGVAGAVLEQAPQVRVDGVHGALGRASLGRSIDPAASAFDVEAFLRGWCDYWRLRALDYEDAYRNLRDYAEKNGLDTVTHGPRRKDHS